MMMIIFWIGLAILIYYLFFNQENGKITFNQHKSAQEQLKERFVKGEIDEKRYLQMKETIK